MADNDSVGKIGLDLEIQGDDIGKQIEQMANAIGNQISKSLEGITSKMDFSYISQSLKKSLNTINENINSSVEKNKENILKAIEEINSKALDCIKSIMSKAKNINIPINFGPVKNISMPNQPTAKTVSPRGPPKINSKNLEDIKAQIDNLSSSLDITNRRIEQQQEKLAGLKQSYNSTFNQARKNKIEEQILKTEAAINKLIAQSDKTGFKLANLDAEFERLSNASKNSSIGVNEANNSIKRTANVANNASRSLRNASNSSRNFRSNINGARSSTGMFIDSMFKWGIVFPIIMKGISAVGSYIGSALMTNAQFANSLAQIRTNLIVAFMPIYQAVLPALNALMSALAKVTAYIAAFISALFGKTYQASFSAAKSMNASIASMQNMEKQGKKTSGAVDKIGDSAEKTKKKIKGALAGFDEINKLSLPEDTDKNKTPKTPKGSGGIDPIPMVSPNVDLNPTSVAMQRINGMVEKLKDILSKIFQPFKAAWAREGAATIASIKYALHGIWYLIKSIGKSFLEVWTNGTGERMLVVILQILQNIFNIIGDIATTFANAWNAGNIGTHIVQTLADAFINVLTLIKHIGDSFREVWGEVGPGVANTFMKVLDATSGVLKNLTKNLLYVWDNGGSHLFKGLIKLGAKIFELAGYIYTQFVVPMINWFINNIAPAIAKVADVLGTVLDAFSGFIDWLMGDGKPVLDLLITTFGLLGGSIGAVKLSVSIITKAFSALSTIMNIVKFGSGMLGSAIALLSNPIGIAVVAIGGMIAIGVTLYKNWDVIKEKGQSIWSNIKNIFYNFKVWLQSVFQRDWSKSFGVLGNLLNAFLMNIRNIFNGARQTFNGIIDFIAGVFTGNWSRAWNGIKEIFRGVFQSLAGIAKAPLNSVIGLINMCIDGLNTISFDTPSWVPGIGGQHFGVNIPKMPYLAKGGIVDKPTQAVIGEAGTEAVVPLENNTGGLDLLANKLTERINNLLLTSSSLLQQPDLTMLGQNTNIETSNINDSNYLEKLKEAIIEAIKEVKDDKEYKNNENATEDTGDIVLKVGDIEFGRIAIKTINKLNKISGKQLLLI